MQHYVLQHAYLGYLSSRRHSKVLLLYVKADDVINDRGNHGACQGPSRLPLRCFTALESQLLASFSLPSIGSHCKPSRQHASTTDRLLHGNMATIVNNSLTRSSNERRWACTHVRTRDNAMPVRASRLSSCRQTGRRRGRGRYAPSIYGCGLSPC